MKQKLFLTLALLMTVCSFGMAQEGNIVYTLVDEIDMQTLFPVEMEL